jgi:hypothetical protein
MGTCVQRGPQAQARPTRGLHSPPLPLVNSMADSAHSTPRVLFLYPFCIIYMLVAFPALFRW